MSKPSTASEPFTPPFLNRATRRALAGNPVAAQANLGTLKEVQAIAPVSRTTISHWLKRGWISAVRIGPRKTLYDLDSVAAMVQPIGSVSNRERVAIAELVAASPDPTHQQIAQLRNVIHTEASGG